MSNQLQPRPVTYDLQQAMEFLHVSESTLLRQARAGIVPGVRVGRKWVFIESDLVAHIRQNYKRPCSIDGHALRTGGLDSSSTEEKSDSRLAQQIARKRKSLRPKLAVVRGANPGSAKSR